MTQRRKRARRRRGESFWRRTLMAQRHSGLSQMDFCRRNELALSTFQYWRRRLRAEPDDAEVEQEAAEPPAFVELVASAPRALDVARLELRFPSGVQLSVPAGVDGRALAEVLWALEATGVC